MKVSIEEKEKIRQDFTELRGKGYTKTVARQMLACKYLKGVTTIFDVCDGMERGEEVDKISSVPEISWPKVYILVSWEIRIRADLKFIACLEQMAKFYNAELLMVPLNRGDVRYIPQIIKDKFHIITEDIQFNENLRLRFIESNALIQSPLSGHSGAYPDTTCIIPGLIKEKKTEASQHYVKQLISTGSIGRLDAKISDYPDVEEGDVKELERKWKLVQTRMYGKPTAIAETYIVPSALVVQVLDSKTFITRFVSSLKSGVVYDLNKRFSPDGYEESQPLALVAGDSHAWSPSPEAVSATKEQIKILNPREVVIQDVFDGRSVNHHEINDPVKFNSAPSIEQEADVTKQYVSDICSISKRVVYLQSNHDNFVNQYLSGPNHYWRLKDNYQIACELQAYRITTGKHPVIKLLDLDSFKNLRFVSEKDNYYIGKVLLKHGHESFRPGFLTNAKIHNFYICGHLHSPCQYRNSLMVGTTSALDQGYNLGPSNWLSSNGLVQPDSSLQSLDIIGGRWK